MCPPEYLASLSRRPSRRRFLSAAIALGTLQACAAHAGGASTEHADDDSGLERREFPGWSRVVDLTHSLHPEFPTFSGRSQLSISTLTTEEKEGYNVFMWQIAEHTGTHLDAPNHFASERVSADRIPVDQLVAPLVVVDIRERSQRDPDSMLELKDLREWEEEHGRIPRGACVAMLSGWDERVNSPEFRNADRKGTLHFPGFAPEATGFLAAERGVAGIAVDTLSLDEGRSKEFPVHNTWLPSNRWGVECVASLAQLPPRGATIVVPAPKIAGATGGPCRVLALV